MRIFLVAIIVMILLSMAFVSADHVSTGDITRTQQNVLVIDNPKAVSQMNVRVIQSGTLTPQGIIKKTNLTLHIPQDGVELFQVTFDPENAGSWTKKNDSFGNTVLLLEFAEIARPVRYRVESVVTNRATRFYNTATIVDDSRYLQETESVVVTPEIRELAYPYQKTIEKAADLTMFVHEYMTYDISLVGERKSSVWALENRRGVCVEHANLLAALLRAAGIPARYVVGYAYSTVDNKMIGHTWVEVPVRKRSGENVSVPFDPTWLQAGYVDATHLVTSRLLDDNQRDTLVYVGSGSLMWQRDDDLFEIIDYDTAPVATLTVAESTFTTNGAGFVKATINTNHCSVFDVSITSCVNERGQPLLNFHEREQMLWACAPTDVYWVYEPASLDRSVVYTCPVSMLEQAGETASANIRLQGAVNVQPVSMNGPDVVSVNEVFALEATAPEGFLFFTSGRQPYGSSRIEESFAREGEYTFYLYADGSLATKTVRVTKDIQFAVVVSAPAAANVNETINITVRGRNLLDVSVHGNIKVTLGDQVVYQGSRQFAPAEEVVLTLSAASRTPGQKKITAEIYENTLASYSHAITIRDAGTSRSWLDAIVSFFAGLFEGLASIFT